MFIEVSSLMRLILLFDWLQDSRSEFIVDEPEIVADEDSYEPRSLGDDLDNANRYVLGWIFFSSL